MDFSDLKGMFAEVKTRMDGAIERVRRDMASVRTGRATVSLLDGIQVDAYGSDADQSGRHSVGARAGDDPGAAVRSVAHGRHREGHPCLRPRAQPGERRKA